MTVQCPHCSQQTVVRQPASRAVEVPQKTSGAWVWIGLALVLIVVGTAAFFFFKPKPTLTVTSSNPPIQTTNVPAAAKSEPKPKSLQDLKVSNVRLEMPKGSGLRYALGTVKNDSEHQRFGVQIELDVFDKNGQPLSGKATDYVQMLEPGKEWKFRALVLDSKAASVKVASIKEQE